MEVVYTSETPSLLTCFTSGKLALMTMSPPHPKEKENALPFP